MSDKPMSVIQREAWLDVYVERLADWFKNKFKCGQLEHSGDLGDMMPVELVDEGIGEALDQLAYLGDMRRRLEGSVIVDARSLEVILCYLKPELISKKDLDYVKNLEMALERYQTYQSRLKVNR